MRRPDELLKVFLPGLGLKRWLVVVVLGLLQVTIGVTIWIVSLLRGRPHPLLRTLTLGFLSPATRGMLAVGSGAALTAYGWRHLSRSLMRVMLPERPETELAEVLRERQRAVKGRRVVIIGGEPGLTPVIRSFEALTRDVRIDVILTATERGYVAQELRDRLGLPGTQVIFPVEDDALLYAELEDGRVLEGATTLNHYAGGRIKDIFLSRDLRRVQVWEADSNGKSLPDRLRDYMPSVADSAIEAISRAEMIVLAPGRIYTQVLPNLTLDRFAQAIRESNATKVFVANLMTEPGRTDGWTVADHLEEIHRITGITLDYAIVHSGSISEAMLEQYRNEGSARVEMETDEDGMSRLIFADTGEQTTLIDGAVIITEDLVTEKPQIVAFTRSGDTVMREMPVVRHSPEKLAPILERLIGGEI